MPLIVGSFNTNGIPLFTLKFALFLVSKLIPTIGKLGLLNDLGSLLFEEKEVFYEDRQLSTAILNPFHFKRLKDKQTQEEEEQSDDESDLNVFKNLKNFFLNILKSKDGRFLECACMLLFNLIGEVKQYP